MRFFDILYPAFMRDTRVIAKNSRFYDFALPCIIRMFLRMACQFVAAIQEGDTVFSIQNLYIYISV